MKSGMRKCFLAVALCVTGTGAWAAGIASQGTWQTTLQARDLNGDGIADAYYDTDLNITWLADANYVKTSGYTTGSALSPLGLLYPSEAESWASSLDVFGVTGWRLPSVSQTVPVGVNPFDIMVYLGGGSYVRFQPEPTFSELAHLYYATLGNLFGDSAPINTGDFLNVQTGIYTGQSWCPEAPDLCGAYVAFDMSNGTQYLAAEQAPLAVWAVRDGDVAPIPEPATYLLMLFGICGTWIRFRTPNRQPPHRGVEGRRIGPMR